MRALLPMLPLLAFWLVESWAGTRVAIAVGIALALAEIGWTRWRDGRVGRLPLFTGGLVVGLGALSLASDDARFVLWTPVLSDLVFAGLLGVAWCRDGHAIAALLREQDPDVDLHPLQIAWLDGLTLRLAANLAVHAALTAWSTTRDHGTWLLVSGPVQVGLLVAQIGLEAAWARLVLLPRIEAEEAARDAR